MCRGKKRENKSHIPFNQAADEPESFRLFSTFIAVLV